MKKIQYSIYTVLLLFVLNACSTTNMEKTNNEKWQLIWEDDFSEANSLDDSKWNVVKRNKADWGNYMSDLPELIQNKNGKLYLRGIVNPDQNADPVPYLTGGVHTKDKFNFTYGKIEIRAKLENAQGAWPAIWMLPNGSKYGEYPRNGEIDLMERLNADAQFYQTIHSYYTLELKETTNPKSGAITPVNATRYNVYGLEWFTDKLVFTLNGVETFVYPRLEDVDASQWPFDQPFYLVLSMQLEGSWVGEAKPEDLPVQMLIDWVKVYKSAD